MKPSENFLMAHARDCGACANSAICFTDLEEYVLLLKKEWKEERGYKIPKLKIGDRVRRRPVQSFKYSAENIGTIIEKRYAGRNHIEWDNPASTGQRHSTIKSKYLIKA